MNLQNESLEELFERWVTILKTEPAEGERAKLKRMIDFTYEDPEYRSKKDPLRLDKMHLAGADQKQPEWLLNMMKKGVTIEENSILAKRVANHTLHSILAVTDGYGKYGDLPENAPHPRIVEAVVESDSEIRYLQAIHELLDEGVVVDSEPEEI